MIKIEHSTMIDRPVDQVWRFMTDIGKIAESLRAVAERTSEGPLGVGSTFRLTRRALGGVRTDDLRVTEWEPDKKMVLLAEFGLGKANLSFGFEPLDGKTRFTAFHEVEIYGLWKVLQPILARSFRKGTRREMAEWKEQLESQVAA